MRATPTKWAKTAEDRGFPLCIALLLVISIPVYALIPHVGMELGVEAASKATGSDLYPTWDALASTDGTNICTNLLSGEVQDYVPGSLRSAFAATTSYWQDVTYGAMSGRVAYMVLNASDLLDANYAGGLVQSNRSSMGELDLSLLPGITNLSLFVSDRAVQGPYYSYKELVTQNRGIDKYNCSNLFVYSFAQDKDKYFCRGILQAWGASTVTEDPEDAPIGLGTDVAILSNKFDVTSITNWMHQKWNPAVFGSGSSGEKHNLWRIADMTLINGFPLSPALDASTDYFYRDYLLPLNTIMSNSLADEFQTRQRVTDVIANIIDYCDEDRMPASVGTTEGIEAVPSVNEIFVEYVSGPSILFGETQYQYRVSFELWYPFLPARCAYDDKFYAELTVNEKKFPEVPGSNPAVPLGSGSWQTRQLVLNRYPENGSEFLDMAYGERGGGVNISMTPRNAAEFVVFTSNPFTVTNTLSACYGFDVRVYVKQYSPIAGGPMTVDAAFGTSAYYFTNALPVLWWDVEMIDPRRNHMWNSARHTRGTSPSISNDANMASSATWWNNSHSLSFTNRVAYSNIWGRTVMNNGSYSALDTTYGLGHGTPIFHRDGPMEHVAELGYVWASHWRGSGQSEWETLDVLNPSVASHMMNRMTVIDRDKPDERSQVEDVKGLVSINSQNRDVLRTLFNNVELSYGNEFYTNTWTLQSNDVDRMADVLIARSSQRPFIDYLDLFCDQNGVLLANGGPVANAIRSCAQGMTIDVGLLRTDPVFSSPNTITFGPGVDWPASPPTLCNNISKTMLLQKFMDLVSFRHNAFIVLSAVQTYDDVGGIASDERDVGMFYRDGFVDRTLGCMSGNHYVATNGASVWPYTNWSDAARSIHNGALAAGEGGRVIVSNGTYLCFEDVEVGDATITKVDGDEVFVDGNSGMNTNGCFSLNHSKAVVEGLVITNGKAMYGAGVHIGHPGGTVRNCVITDNEAFGYWDNTIFDWVGLDGAGVYAPSSNGIVQNCTIVNNGAGGGIHGGGGAAMGKPLGCSVYNSLVCSNSSGDIGACNIYSCNTGPVEFKDYDNDDYRLTYGSSCIDSGVDLSAVISNDIDGRLRPLGAGFDIGAYEYDFMTTDSDEDGIMDSNEVWMSFSNPLKPDTDSDGLTDSNEFWNTLTDVSNPDTDNDGQNDGDEVGAGTSPTNNSVLFKIDSVIASDSLLSWDTVPGKEYCVMTTINILDPGSWENVPQSGYTNVVGTGIPLIYTNAQTDPYRYFKVTVK